MLSVLIAPCLAAGSQTDVQPHPAPGPWRKQEIYSCCCATKLSCDIIRWIRIIKKLNERSAIQNIKKQNF